MEPTEEQFAAVGRTLYAHAKEGRNIFRAVIGKSLDGDRLEVVPAFFLYDDPDRRAFEAWKAAMQRPMITPERTGDVE